MDPDRSSPGGEDPDESPEARSEAAEGYRLRNEVLAKRKKIVAALEQARGSKVITLVHRREPWGNKERDHLTVEDSEYVLSQIVRTSPEKPIDVVVHTPGGVTVAAEMIAMALRTHPGPVTVMVPFYAMSSGTTIALAADQILMEIYSVLGPLDPVVGGQPAGALLALLKRKPIQSIQDQTVIQAELAQMAVQRMRNFVQWLLRGRMPEQQLAQVADFLTGGYMTHDTPITFATAQSLGLPVAQGVPPEVYDFFDTCEFGNCRRPSLASLESEGLAGDPQEGPSRALGAPPPTTEPLVAEPLPAAARNHPARRSAARWTRTKGQDQEERQSR